MSGAGTLLPGPTRPGPARPGSGTRRRLGRCGLVTSWRVPMAPRADGPGVFSESMCDLVIYKMSDCSASAAGGRDIILLCDKVTKGEFTQYYFTAAASGLHTNTQHRRRRHDVTPSSLMLRGDGDTYLPTTFFALRA